MVSVFERSADLDVCNYYCIPFAWMVAWNLHSSGMASSTAMDIDTALGPLLINHFDACGNNALGL